MEEALQNLFFKTRYGKAYNQKIEDFLLNFITSLNLLRQNYYLLILKTYQHHLFTFLNQTKKWMYANLVNFTFSKVPVTRDKVVKV